MINCTRCGALTPTDRIYQFVDEGKVGPPYCLSCKQVVSNPRPKSCDHRNDVLSGARWPRNNHCYRRKLHLERKRLRLAKTYDTSNFSYNS